MVKRRSPEQLASELRQEHASLWARRVLAERAENIRRVLHNKRITPTEQSINSLLVRASDATEPGDRIGELSLGLDMLRQRVLARGAFVVVLSEPKLEVRRENSDHTLTTSFREWSLMNGRPYFAYSDFDLLQLRFGSFSIAPRAGGEPGLLQHETTILPYEAAEITARVVDAETARDIALICAG